MAEQVWAEYSRLVLGVVIAGSVVMLVARIFREAVFRWFYD